MSRPSRRGDRQRLAILRKRTPAEFWPAPIPDSDDALDLREQGRRYEPIRDCWVRNYLSHGDHALGRVDGFSCDPPAAYGAGKQTRWSLRTAIFLLTCLTLSVWIAPSRAEESPYFRDSSLTSAWIEIDDPGELTTDSAIFVPRESFLPAAASNSLLRSAAATSAPFHGDPDSKGTSTVEDASRPWAGIVSPGNSEPHPEGLFRPDSVTESDSAGSHALRRATEHFGAIRGRNDDSVSPGAALLRASVVCLVIAGMVCAAGKSPAVMASGGLIAIAFGLFVLGFTESGGPTALPLCLICAILLGLVIGWTAKPSDDA